MNTYSEKLKSPKWQKKRLAILNRDKFTCLGCNDTETELHVHHVKYTKEPFDAPNKDLQTLCKHCHELIEILNKNPKYKYLPPILKHDNKICVSLPTGFMLFKIEGKLVLESFIGLDGPLLKFIRETNISNGKT